MNREPRTGRDWWELVKVFRIGRAAVEGATATWQREKHSRDSRSYQQLLNAVESKFPGETRHATALRYIREREAAHREGSEPRSWLPSGLRLKWPA